MEKAIRVISRLNNQLYADAIPGHFATNHSHINYYIDMSAIKHSLTRSALAARMISTYYSATNVDTILCLEGTEYIGAYLARELSKGSMGTMNQDKDIFLVEPDSNVNGQFIFADNLRHMVQYKDVLVLVTSASTGQTLTQARECIEYYGGRIAGYSALFANIDELGGLPVIHVFSGADFPHYHNVAQSHECPECRAGKPLDAIVTPRGYKLL
ncbi:phosphoribosyltransferase [Intestinibacillus massiliensis]|nr:phosphoribosyltransferase [Intestinibacillus massiliensis]